MELFDRPGPYNSLMLPLVRLDFGNNVSFLTVNMDVSWSVMTADIIVFILSV